MLKKILSLNLLLAAMIWCGVAMAEIDDAYSAYRQGDYKTALAKFKREAKKGNHDAKFYLGLMYATGQGVEKNPTRAIEWFRKSAIQGNAGAQVNLGNMYYQGLGVEKDYKKAAEWYRKAADQNLAPAQYSMGLLYESGLGVDADLKKAEEWYRKAAEQGYALAEYNLGVLLAEGRLLGVPDNKQALQWLEKAADQAYAQAQFNVAYMYFWGQGTKKDMAVSYKWATLGAKSGDEKCKSMLEDIKKLMDKKEIEKGNELVSEWEKAHSLLTQ